MESPEFGEVVESATRNIVYEGFRRSAVCQDDLVGLGFDVIDSVSFAELGKRNAGYRRSVDQGSRLAKNAVHEHRVIGGNGQVAMRQKRSPPKDPAEKRTGISRSAGPKRVEIVW